jgi:hypothetical protein
MSNYNSKERLIAALLSSTPILKSALKRFYVYLNFFLHRKNYFHRILNDSVKEIHDRVKTEYKESFFGYYDKCPLKGCYLISHISLYSSLKKPDPKHKIKIAITNIHNGKTEIIGDTSAYTWQQGARAHWLNDDLIIYNDFDEVKRKYISKVFSISNNCIVKQFDYPVQDSCRTDFFLSVNYERIMNLRPDYGYRNLPKLSYQEMSRLDNDGIYKIDYNTGKSELIHSLAEITCIEKDKIYDASLHKVNHIMINQKGNGFIFIHRYYHKNRRFDRLMYSDFKTLSILANNEMVSHCCWMDDRTIFGYFRFNKKNGFYLCDIQTKKITSCEPVNKKVSGDGHPSCCNDFIVFDTYPDKSGMQKLMLFNRKTNELMPLLEVFHGIKYMNQTRCDLHPRFSDDGNLIFFDSVFTGIRRQYYINIEKLKQ